jgi:uncharacterized metal-binding protein YceD (DUF177 family)
MQFEGMTKLEDYLKQFVIQFSGLELGLHEYEFHIVDMFFERFQIEDVLGGDILVNFSLTKRENMMEFIFKFNGKLKSSCDRCLDDLDILIQMERELIVKFSDATDETNDELLVVGYEQYQIDIAPFLYEFITLDVPLRKVHQENDCNPEVIERLHPEINKSVEEDEVPSVWDKLKKLK